MLMHAFFEEMFTLYLKKGKLVPFYLDLQFYSIYCK